MQMLKLIGQIDEHHRLIATVPETVAPGTVEILVVVPSAVEDEESEAWMAGVAREWHAELSDVREDIYTLEDGVAS